MSAAPRASRRGSRLGEETFTFSFDGRDYPAQAGDTAASALTAAGVRLLNRSIKYRRARGLLAHGPEEPNALVSVGAPPACIPNVPMPQLVLRPGLRLYSQNRWPGLRWDLAALLLGPGRSLWGAGFYYKTFMWPSWRSYEPLIRKLAGLGYAPGASELSRVRVEHLVADVLVAGAGPAGLVAALGAARAGARVIVCERDPAAGGELDFESAMLDGVPGLVWVARALSELASLGATVLTHTALVSTAQGMAIAHRQPAGMPGQDTLYRLYAPAFINAMGAVERGIAFIDNDRPGVMLSGAADRLLGRYGVLPGQSIVLFGNHDRVYATARRLLSAGARIRAVIDTRAGVAGDAQAPLVAAGVECISGHTVVSTRGRPELASIVVAPLAAGRTRAIACDTLLVSGGWGPAVHAGLRLGGEAHYQASLAAFIARSQPDWRRDCGAAAGELVLADVVRDAHDAARAALRTLGRDAGSGGSAPTVDGGDGQTHLEPYWRAPATLQDEKRQFIDLQNDVTVADLRQSLAEGFCEIEHVKRYTTLGVGTEQGRTGGTLGAAILAELRGEPLASVGTSRSRGPYQPVPMIALSGLRVGMGLRPERRTPLHDLHLAMGGVLELMGGWMRPRYYTGNGGDAEAASQVEAARVRAHGGVCDGSTLGKIEIAGPDAGVYIDLMYLSPPSTIALSRARYAALLREDGIVLDDGLVLRLGAQRYLATTSSSHTAQVLSHLEFHRDCAKIAPRVSLTDVTEAWSVLIVAGPQSRAVLGGVLGAPWAQPLADLAHMGFCDGQHDGARVRLLRASFSGELAYELHCEPRIAPALWARIVEAGLPPFGLEALDVLRVEKGYLTSSELNGQTAPRDVLLDRMIKPGHQAIGMALLERPAYIAADRPILVGVRTADPASRLLGGAQLTTSATSPHSLGYVTSAVYSPQLHRWVGLALLARTHAQEGTELIARDPLRTGNCRVVVTSPVHFDPDGGRLRT